ncbi:hypothetical protein QP185_21485 [Sphingomonas aerolata]|uniref:hypothetical protein n=1 Tax=Sphingomonas aerolata TaxID=185951 RepID=UPI002FE3C817
MKITSYDGMLASLAPEGVPPFHVGILIGPGFVPMDIIGVQTVLAMMPGSQIHFIWKNYDVVRRLSIVADRAYGHLRDVPSAGRLCGWYEPARSPE